MAIGAAVVVGMGVIGGMSAKSREKRARAGFERAGQQARETYQPFYQWGLESLYGRGNVPDSFTPGAAPRTGGLSNVTPSGRGPSAGFESDMGEEFLPNTPRFGGGQPASPAPTPPAETDATDGTEADPAAGGSDFTGPLPTDIASLRDLINNPSQIRSDPQYQFLAQEGGRAVGNILSGRGKLLSGEGGRNFQSFGQNLASTFLDSIINRRMTGINTLFKQLGVGQDAATGIANAFQGQATNVASTLQGQDPLLAGIQQGVGGAMGIMAGGFGGAAAGAAASQPRQGNARFSPLSTYNYQSSR